MQTTPWRYFVLLLLGVAVWINTDTFLWRDDWDYLQQFDQGNFSLLKGDLRSDIKPLFQYLLFPQFAVFGSHFLLFQLVNISLHVAAGVAMLWLLSAAGVRPGVQLLMAGLFIVQPVHFVNLFWIFQQCELAHLFLLVLGVALFLRFLDSPTTLTLVGLSLALLAQQFFFPTGILFPVAMLLVILILPGAATRRLMACLAIIIAVYGIHLLYLQNTFTSVSSLSQGVVLGWLDKVNYLLRLMGSSVIRLVLPNYKAEYMALNLAAVVSLVVFAIAIYRHSVDQRKRRAILTAILGILAVNAILMITRYQTEDIHYYYTSLTLPWLFLLIGLGIDSLPEANVTRAGYLVILVSLIYTLADQKGKFIFADRNRQNLSRMNQALQHGADYEPVDDPMLFLEQSAMTSPPTELFRRLSNRE